ncbi:MAG: diaminopimelate epimerase [Actinomycetota bacterium]
MSELRFAKYHGTGNDFVLYLDLEGRRPLDARLAAALCDRRFGVGADGVIRVARDEEGADLFMDYRNADGSLAEMCGNGIRCLAAFAVAEGVWTGDALAVGTRSGRRELRLRRDGRAVREVTVSMGAPALRRGDIPMTGAADETFLGQPFEAAGRVFRASAVSMGNPHLVLLLDEDPDGLDVATIGPTIERDPRFPQGVNVEFVVAKDDVLVTRVWERGSGLTMACGTGACAVLVAADEAGLVSAAATVRFPGGEVRVERTGDDVLLTGPAERTFDGVVADDWLAARGLA